MICSVKAYMTAFKKLCQSVKQNSVFQRFCFSSADGSKVVVQREKKFFIISIPKYISICDLSAGIWVGL